MWGWEFGGDGGDEWVVGGELEARDLLCKHRARVAGCPALHCSLMEKRLKSHRSAVKEKDFLLLRESGRGW